MQGAEPRWFVAGTFVLPGLQSSGMPCDRVPLGLGTWQQACLSSYDSELAKSAGWKGVIYPPSATSSVLVGVFLALPPSVYSESVCHAVNSLLQVEGVIRVLALRVTLACHSWHFAGAV